MYFLQNKFYFVSRWKRAAKDGASPSEFLAAYSGWGAVHGNGGSYTRMALTLVDKVLGGTFKQPMPPPRASDGVSKRKPNPPPSPAERVLSPPPAATTAWIGSLTSRAATPGAASPATTAAAAAPPAPPGTSGSTFSATAPQAVPRRTLRREQRLQKPLLSRRQPSISSRNYMLPLFFVY
jgi:hypothetical protein